MTQDLKKEEGYHRERLYEWLMGNIHAVEYCMATLKSVHFWDDVADGEKLTPDDVVKALISISYEIPLNPFYDVFRLQLTVLMTNTILCWQDANVLDHGSEHDMHISYGLRSAGIQVIAYCAFLIGGVDWARKVGPEIRRLLIEDLHGFVKEMKDDISKRSL